MLDREKIERRQLKPHEVGVAALIAGFHELGILNQAAVFQATQRSGRALAEYAKLVGKVPSNPLEALNLLNELTPLAVEVTFSQDENAVTVRINTETCKYCPKGVGGAELEGSLCPYPGLILGFLSGFFQGAKIQFFERKPLRKVGKECEMVFKF